MNSVNSSIDLYLSLGLAKMDQLLFVLVVNIESLTLRADALHLTVFFVEKTVLLDEQIVGLAVDNIVHSSGLNLNLGTELVVETT